GAAGPLSALDLVGRRARGGSRRGRSRARGLRCRAPGRPLALDVVRGGVPARAHRARPGTTAAAARARRTGDVAGPPARNGAVRAGARARGRAGPGRADDHARLEPRRPVRGFAAVARGRPHRRRGRSGRCADPADGRSRVLLARLDAAGRWSPAHDPTPQIQGFRRMIVPVLLFLAAQQPQDTLVLKPVVVTATRVPLSVDRIASSVTVLRGVDLVTQGVRTVADALETVPGADIVETGSYGGQTSLFLRGGESDYVKVLLDGVPLNQAGGGIDLAHLTTDNVDRIEIVRGPVSVLYGSDAMTG